MRRPAHEQPTAPRYFQPERRYGACLPGRDKFPNEHLAVWLVKWRYDPWEASVALLRASNTLPKFGGGRADAQSKLEQALGFRITR
jgi:hypothetical protein